MRGVPWLPTQAGRVRSTPVSCAGPEWCGEEAVMVVTLPHFSKSLAEALNIGRNQLTWLVVAYALLQA